MNLYVENVLLGVRELKDSLTFLSKTENFQFRYS